MKSQTTTKNPAAATETQTDGQPIATVPTPEKSESEDLYARAVRRLEPAAKHSDIHPEALERLKHPLSVLEVSIPVRTNDGVLRIFQGYLVRDVDTRGPTQGGILYHPDVVLC